MRGTVPPVFLRIDDDVLNYIECEDNFLLILREYHPQNRM
jgi:hypothetical protein